MVAPHCWENWHSIISSNLLNIGGDPILLIACKTPTTSPVWLQTGTVNNALVLNPVALSACGLNLWSCYASSILIKLFVEKTLPTKPCSGVNAIDLAPCDTLKINWCFFSS